MHFGYRAITSYGASFQKLLLYMRFVTHPSIKWRYRLTTPRVTYCYAHSVWASPRSLAATSGMLFLVYFPPGTKMFQFPGCAPSH